MQNKKTILKLLLFLLLGNISTLVYSQQVIGFKGGYNVSTSEFNFGTSGSYFVNRIDLLSLSVFAEFEKNNFYTFYPNLHFVQRGNIQRNDLLWNENIINYLGVSLLSKLVFFKEKIEIYGLVGPQLDFAINARLIEKTGEPGFNVHRGNVDFEEIRLSRFDINLQTGFGLAKVNDKYKILLEGTYDLPFYDINLSENVNQRNFRNIGILLGLSFYL